MKRITTIVWDLDGTLTYTLQDLCDAVNYAMRQHHLPEHTIEEVRQYVGNGVRRLMVLSVPGGEEHPDFEAIFATFKDYYMIHCKDHTCLYDGVAETLCALKQKGYRMAIVSNKLQSGVDELFHEYFESTIEVAVGECPPMARKPQPDMVFKALELLGVSREEAVYIGDSDVDLATARNSGLPCISVLWGFRDREFLESCGATTFASVPSDIIDIISKI